MTLKLPADNGIMLCDSVTNEQEESSIRAKIKLTYSWANNKNDIKKHIRAFFNLIKFFFFS